MKASEYIQRLEALIKEHGDLEVKVLAALETPELLESYPTLSAFEPYFLCDWNWWDASQNKQP